MSRTIAEIGATPKYLACDRGGQFDCDGFRRWCQRRGIRIRYGAIGKHGSIAVVERFILTFKQLLRQLPLVPMRRAELRQEIDLLLMWYNEHRPHNTLRVRTPNEVYYNRFPQVRKPRYEPRSHWPRGSPCAKPWALMRHSPGARLTLELGYPGDRRHLPVVALRRAG
jgi:hypothetical protein